MQTFKYVTQIPKVCLNKLRLEGFAIFVPEKKTSRGNPIILLEFAFLEKHANPSNDI